MAIKIKTFVKGMLQNNVYLIYDEAQKDGAIIDLTQFKKGDDLDEFISENNIKIKNIILTHGHADHIGGVLDYLKEYKDTKVIACKDEKDVLGIADNNYTKDLFKNGFSVNPDIFVDEGDEIKINDNLIMKVIKTPGHTPGGICLYIKENKENGINEPILFSGDTLFYMSCGRADLYGGNWDTLVSSIRSKLYTLPKNTKVYSGHGEETEIGFEIKNNPYVGLDFDYAGE